MRLTAALVACLWCVSSATATLFPRDRDAPSLASRVPAALSQKKAESSEEKPRFVLTDKTEVMLDGQACAIQEVPKGASIILLEVAADKKTILKIHFRSGEE